MGRIIGLIGGTCLLIAVLRLTPMQHDDQTLKAGVGVATSQPKATPRDAYRRGKEMYLRGRYDEALPLLTSATASTGLNAADRKQAEEYLARTQLKLAQQATDVRAQSPDTEFAPDAASDPVADATRTRVERLMAQSIAAAKRGDQQEAFKLAQQANQLAKAGQLKFNRNEITPAALLAQLQAHGGAKNATAAKPKSGGMPAWADDTLTGSSTGVKTAAVADAIPEFELVAGVDATPEMDVPTKGLPAEAAAPKGVIPPKGAKAQAQALVESARGDLKAGRFAEARRKAMEAEQLDVSYDLFDDRPELVIAEIDRRGGTMTLVSNEVPAPAKAAPAKGNPAPAGNAVADNAKQQAMKLLELAREDLKNGNVEAAKEKADKAQQLDVAYKLFEDRPELVLNDVAANMAAANIAKNDVPAPTVAAADPVSTNAKQQAKALLSQAREALAEGRIAEARKYAVEAEGLKAPYGLFDDRPEIVLADIARASARGPEPTLSNIAKKSEGMPTGNGPSAPGIDAGNKVATTKTPAKATGTPRQQADQLLKDARGLMAAGRLDEAKFKAEAAEKMNIAYDVFDDRPDLVLSEIAQASASNIAKNDGSASNRSEILTADAQFDDKPQTAMTFTAGASPAAPAADFDSSPAIIAPAGPSAAELYAQGMAELGRGNREGAYQAFQAAHRTGQRLDNIRNQRLQDYLRELAPRQSKIQLTNAQVSDQDLTPTPFEEPSALEMVEQQQSIKFDRLRTDTLNAIFRAERLREKDPEQAMQIIDQQMAAVEGAELGQEAAASLMRSLQKTHGSLQNEVMQQKPNLEQKKKNEETLTLIERSNANKIRIEQEFASLVEEYNTLYQQRRFAEAEVISKKARELDPKNPAAETMFWKARFARRIENNENLKLAKEESFIKQLDEVDWASVANVGDDPIDFGKDWKDINARRKGKYKADNRTRSEDELRIEESLTRRISLHEDNVPLSEVMRKIATVAGISIMFDQLGLEEEGVSSNSPITIDVDGITVKSALNLMLEQYRLGYMIQDEVLKITSKMRQQGELVVATYPVADLVVPIPSFAPTMSNPLNVMGMGSGVQGMGGGQMSVPPTAGQPFAQIGPGANGLDAMAGLTGTDRLTGGSPTVDFDTLVDLISTTVAPDSWSEVGGNASIRQYETTLSLVIRQTQKVHEEIADLLDQLRRLQDLQVTIEVRFVTVADRFFERIGIDFDFNIQDSVGGPDIDNANIPLQPFGSVLVPQGGLGGATGTTGAAGVGAAGQQQQQQQGQAGQFFTPGPRRQLTNRDNYPRNTVVGLSNPGTFSSDLDVPFRQGSFEVGVPDFGGFNPNAGIQVGLAVLSDIEAFFFIQAAQGDERSNLMFAPKVTLFNGQTASVNSTVSRPFVISLIPTVGFFSTGFQPVIQFFPDGVQLFVQAVISADRRFVRLTVTPFFTNITDVFTFSFVGGGGGGGQTGQGGNTGNITGGGFGGGQAGGGTAGGGGQFGIGGGMGTTQMVMNSMFNQGITGGQGGGGNTGNQGGQNNQANNLTVTVQQPVLEIVTVNTTVSVPDGGTVLLGGVKRLREGRNMAGVPILNKIPYVSRLFKNTGVGRETESLMLMVTPRIIIQEEEEELLGISTE